MSDELSENPGEKRPSALNRLIGFCLENKLIVVLMLTFFVFWGLKTAPFDWNLGWLQRNPIPTDAIPDIGENQQIVFTEWMGRSPQDVEDQVSYPLTVSLLGVPGVKTIRSYSAFGFSSIYIIFKENVDFYWSRSRVLEKLNSLPAGTLPDGVQPVLGPDATSLGQIFWYTLEGRNEAGEPAGGWDLHELRSVQDWYVRYAFLSADGVSEVASIGGFVQEYQVDVDPDAMRSHDVTLDQVFHAVQMANIDVGARSIEVNRVEYFIRGLGFIKEIADLEKSVIKVNDNVPIYVKDVAHVTLGPALRRGALDKQGAEAVGGVVVVRYGENPLATIKNVKQKIAEISDGLPEKVVVDYTKVTREEVERFATAQGFDAYGRGLKQDEWLTWFKRVPLDQRPDWLNYTKVTVVPFYDRTGLIYETLGTLNVAIFEEILVTILVVLIMVRHLASSGVISGLLPVAVLMTFIAMSLFGVDANIVALSGIAIAIGTMVDMGIVICENILRRLEESKTAGAGASSLQVIYRATCEVGGAVLTAVATTIVGFLPVFAMEGAEGKLFKPLAFTKTFALVASIIIALTIIPAVAHVLFTGKIDSNRVRRLLHVGLSVAGLGLLFVAPWWIAAIVLAYGIFKLLEHRVPQWIRSGLRSGSSWIVAGIVAIFLANSWLPLGPESGSVLNFLFVALLVGGVLGLFLLFQKAYPAMLRWMLDHKTVPSGATLLLVLWGGLVWLGFDKWFGWLPQPVRTLAPVSWVEHKFPGLGKEFMPPLDEGSYLFMPSTMFHASIGEVLDVLQKQDMSLGQVPEIDTAVGKLGRVESSLDPAPISMIETVINYKPQYLVDRDGHRLRFRFSRNEIDSFRDEAGNPVSAPDGVPYQVRGKFHRDDQGRLIPDPSGMPFRLWRPELDPDLNEGRTAWPGIRKPDDIWDQVVEVTAVPGTSSAPRLQPIAARLVMLQSGMRAPMGLKVKGPDLETIDRVAVQIESYLKEIPSVQKEAVLADRIVGKPYLEIDIDREAIARYGVNIRQVQNVIEVAIGGKRITSTVEGRERYPVRVRYLRELRDQIETLERILVPAMSGAQIPLAQLATFNYVRGPQMIKSEDTFLVGYVIFDKKPGYAEVDVVEECQEYLNRKIEAGDFILPAGVSYTFAGSYQNQIRAAQKLAVVVPVTLFLIFFILYLQFRSVATALMVFSGVFVAWTGGFIMLWFYAQPWFLNFSILGTDLRELFQIHPVNLSVAVWVGFLALFGIASDNGVLVATFLDQQFAAGTIKSVDDIRQTTIAGAERRLRPALMTSATTMLALLPVLTSSGRGSDIMIPMAIPSFGGMAVALITIFVVPILYCAVKEVQFKRTNGS